ncbi:uncharacterized protein LOC116843261 [Odontomachus brunneus]|uniref:uncharacterized protein LOC116843261 n=1 Tax=Odontomachus brunneus TaxID=486640 RepID=UPI0013F2A7CF|nr:uncharacterized protein LOC116843261 [Odontomachus brunneus]
MLIFRLVSINSLATTKWLLDKTKFEVMVRSPDIQYITKLLGSLHNLNSSCSLMVRQARTICGTISRNLISKSPCEHVRVLTSEVYTRSCPRKNVHENAPENVFKI